MQFRIRGKVSCKTFSAVIWGQKISFRLFLRKKSFDSLMVTACISKEGSRHLSLTNRVVPVRAYRSQGLKVVNNS